MKGRLGKTASGISGTYEIVESMIINMKKGTIMNMKMKKEAGTAGVLIKIEVHKIFVLE